jgi:ribosomal protein L27
MGRDFTIFAKAVGTVRFAGNKRVYVNVDPAHEAV